MIASATAPFKEIAKDMCISAQYLSDILHAKRSLSPKLVTAFCKAAGRPDMERKWHRRAAREQGWLI